jgi:hypothetical protein
LRELLQDEADHSLKVLVNITIPKSEDCKAACAQIGVTSYITPALPLARMLTAINLDGNFWVVASEVDNVAVDWDLSPEVEALLAQFPEVEPQF